MGVAREWGSATESPQPTTFAEVTREAMLPAAHQSMIGEVGVSGSARYREVRGPFPFLGDG